MADLRARRRIDIAEAESEQNIFEMLDHLWNTRHTERLRFLRGEYDRDEVAEALARFDALGCELVTHEARMAKREVRYREEVFESTRELRGLDPATEDELVRAKFILTAARTRREHRSRRTRACKR